MDQSNKDKAQAIGSIYPADFQNILWIRNLIYKLSEQNFSGILHVSFDKGIIQQAKEERTLKPERNNSNGC